jgi:hypothetical protein
MKNTEEGTGLPSAGAKVEKPFIVNVVGVLHGPRGVIAGRAEDRAERETRRKELAYIMTLNYFCN